MDIEELADFLGGTVHSRLLDSMIYDEVRMEGTEVKLEKDSYIITARMQEGKQKGIMRIFIMVTDFDKLEIMELEDDVTEIYSQLEERNDTKSNR